MKDTQSAIATLSAFVNTQQPLLDIIKQTIEVLQGNYDQAIKEGDLKNTLDQVTALTTTVTNKDQEILTLTSTVKETQDKLDSAKEELNTAAETIATLQAAQIEPSPVEKLPPTEEIKPSSVFDPVSPPKTLPACCPA